MKEWILVCLCLFASVAGARAQTPEAALDLLVWVRTSSGAQSAGMIFGSLRDSVFVVTTRHTVLDVQHVTVQVTPDDTAHAAEVRWVDPDRDFAILAFGIRDVQGRWRLPTVVERRPTEIRWDFPLFAIGCAPQCWWPARRARHQFFRGDYTEDPTSWNAREIFFRTDYLEGGFSGGLLVDFEGAVLGLITSTGSALGRALWWEELVPRLEALGFAVNLSPRRALRGRTIVLRISRDLTPVPGKDWDGARLLAGGRAEAALVLPGLHELVIGLDRVGFHGRPTGSRDAARNDGVILHYLLAGYRYRIPLSLRRSHSAAVGGDLLFPLAAWGVTTVPGDSVDVQTGERVPTLEAVDISAATSMSLRWDFRLYITEEAGVSLDAAVFIAQLRDWEPSTHYRLSAGIDLRIPIKGW